MKGTFCETHYLNPLERQRVYHIGFSSLSESSLNAVHLSTGSVLNNANSPMCLTYNAALFDIRLRIQRTFNGIDSISKGNNYQEVPSFFITLSSFDVLKQYRIDTYVGVMDESNNFGK